MTDQIDTDKIIRCLREYHAAENAQRRAWEELNDAMPRGVIILHKVPGKENLYWEYERWPDKEGFTYTVSKKEDVGARTAIIIEAPGPREEILPRLLGDKP